LGVRPYVNFLGARYSSDVLSGNPALIGKGLRIYVEVKDLRRVRAYFENGQELGFLVANRPWCFTAHSLRTRREILRLQARGKLRYREGDDAIEAYVKYKRKEALRHKGAVRDLAKVAAMRAPASSVETLRGTPSAAKAGSAAPDPLPRPSLPRPPRPPMPADPRIKPLRIRKAILF